MNTFFYKYEAVVLAVVGLVALVVVGLDVVFWR
jgi:hypothetical protein